MIAFDPRSADERVRIIDLHPKLGDLQAEAVAGLRRSEKALPCKYFYDDVGARLFEVITELPEYYLTRTEMALFDQAPGVEALVTVVGGVVHHEAQFLLLQGFVGRSGEVAGFGHVDSHRLLHEDVLQPGEK